MWEGRGIVLVPRPDVDRRESITKLIGPSNILGVSYTSPSDGIDYRVLIRFSKMNALLAATLSDDWGHEGDFLIGETMGLAYL